MKMRRSLSVLIGITFFHFLSFAQDIHFKLVTLPPEALASAVLGITQDTNGFLWIATQNGLYKYDGYQYTTYINQSLNSNSPASNYIESIASDKAGYIWLATRGTGIDRLDPSTGVFRHFQHDNNAGSVISDTVNVIMQDHEGTIWIGTSNGLDTFNKKTNSFFHFRNKVNDPSSLSCNKIKAIYEDKQGTIWVGTGTTWAQYDSENQGGLNKLNKKTGKFTRYMHNDNDPHSLSNNWIRAIFEDSRGNFWIGTAVDGLHTMDRVKGTFERHLYDPSNPGKLSRPPVKNTLSSYGSVDHITFINEDNKGRIWIGTFGGGINVYDPSTQKVSYYGADKNSKEKLEDNSFWVCYKTSDNILWISTYKNSGATNFYKIIPYQNTLPHIRTGKAVYSYIEDNAHSLWLGTSNGLIHKENNGQEEQFLINKDSTSLSNQIYRIEKINDDFWLLTNHGLYLFNPVAKTFTRYHRQPGNINSLISDSVFTVKKDAGNNLWFGTFYGLDRLDTKSGTFTHFQNKVNDTLSISNNGVIDITIDKSENVWIATNQGLNRFNKQAGNFKRYLNQSTIISVVEDHEGVLWCCTLSGLYKYNKEKDAFLIFTDETGIISQSITAGGITEDRQHNLWIVSLAGIIQLDKERKNAILYSKNQGVSNTGLTASGYARQNGEILFGDTSGYFDFKPELLQQNISAPFITINNFLLNDIPVQPSANGVLSMPFMQTNEIKLRHNENTFSFQFSNIDFISEHEDTRLLYMLQNYDDVWRKAGDEKTAYYFNLPPGKYLFKVKAFNAAGITAEKDITIIISPPWWKTLWAYILYGICFLTLSFFANRFIRNRIIEKERIKSREKELEQAKEIEKAYTELKATQQQLIQAEKMASLGELTAGIAHEIQNPLNFVNNFSEINKEMIAELKEEADKGNIDEVKAIANDIEANEEKINHHGKRADAIVKGMLQHSRKSSGQKELTDINALCNEYLRLSYHGMRAKDKSFNAEFQTNFDGSIGKINIIPQDIGRVLLNLFNNAFYAVYERSRDIVNKQLSSNADLYKPTVSVSTKKSGNSVIITVSDNGNGISQKIVDKIFQPFFTTKPTGEGTGLGLSLSYDIIKAHGGEIKVESKEGEGSEFIVQLPTTS